MIERFRNKFLSNGRNDHVTMFILHLPLAVFSFSVKLSSFALASNARIILHYSHLCAHFLKGNLNANLSLSVTPSHVMHVWVLIMLLQCQTSSGLSIKYHRIQNKLLVNVDRCSRCK